MNKKSMPLGFTLIELIAALLGSTVLVLTLVGTIAMATMLLAELPSDEEQWRRENYSRLLAEDLRYATVVDNQVGYSSLITRPQRGNGNPIVVNYTSYQNGLTRQYGSEPTVTHHEFSPGFTYTVDGRSAPTSIVAGPKLPFVQAVAMAESGSRTSNVTVEIPPGTKPGDLLVLAVANRSNTTVTMNYGNWQMQEELSRGMMDLRIFREFYDAAWPSLLEVNLATDQRVSVILLAIGDTNPFPVSWHSSSSGFYPSDGEPQPLNSVSIDDKHLNLQFVAAFGDPLESGGLASPGFVDKGIVITTTGILTRHTLAVASRHGTPPSMSSQSTVHYNQLGFYLQAALAIRGAD